MTYLSFMSKFANKRTFEAANEGTPGAGDGAGDEATKAADEAAAAAASEKAISDAKAASDAAAAEAAKSDDPKLQAAAAEKAELLREVMDKKDKLKAATKEVADTKKALEAYGGVDPAKVKELLRKEAEAESKEAEARGDFDRVKAMMITEHERAIAAKDAELTEARAGRDADRSLIDELTIGNSFGNSTFIRESLNISPAKTRQLYGAHFERQDGMVVGYDKPVGAKDRTMLVNAKGEALSFDDALGRIVDADPEKKGLTKSKAKPGASSASDLDKGAKSETKLVGKAQIASILSSLDE